MQRLVQFASGVSGTGIFCPVTATNYTGAPASSGVLSNAPGLLVSGTLYANAGAGLTSASLVPVFLGPDGNYYPLATVATPTAAGFIFNFQQTTPVPGLAIQVTVSPVGGVLFLAVIAAQL